MKRTLFVIAPATLISIESGGMFVYSGLSTAVTSRRLGENRHGFVQKITNRLQRHGLL